MATPNTWRLDGKIALVTGGSEGIGLAVAKELVSLGAEVIIASRSKTKLENAVAEINSENVSAVQADLSTASGQNLLLQNIVELGALDILVNNLGQADRGTFLEMDDSRIQSQIQLNLLATLSLTKSLYPYLKKAQGSVINVSSVAGQRALPNRLWYGVVKAGLDQATRALASEWGGDGIRVNAVAPWFTETPLTRSALSNPEMKKKILNLTPIKRVAAPQDIAKAVAFLAMPASSYVTGVILPVDGGYTAQGGLG